MSAGVNIEYKGESIATIPDTGSKTIKTQGKYCEGDILVEYEAPPTPSPTLQSKTVTPTTSQQSVTPDSGYDGLSDVTVNATPLEAKTVTPTSQQQVVTPTTPNIGFSSVTVGAAPQPTLITKQITENGTYTAAQDGADGYSEVTVDVPIPEPVAKKDVNLYDYDGAIIYSYTVTEFLDLAVMPEAPIHEGLLFQEWNWSLQNAKEYARKAHFLNIGAVYTTDNGETRYVMTFPDFGSAPVSIKITSLLGTVSIDWGDGSVHDTVSNSSAVVTHLYDFCSLAQNEITIKISYSGDNGYKIGYYNSLWFKRFLKKVFIGDHVIELESYSFADCKHMETIAISKIQKINAHMIYGDYQCTFLIIPKGVILSFYCFDSGLSLLKFCSPDDFTLSSSIFEANYCLENICLPNTVNVISSSSFSHCKSLCSIWIPNSCNSIGQYAFNDCPVLTFIDLSDYTDAENIPSLESTNAISTSNTDLVIYVANQEMLDAFSAATNWSTYADRFQIKGASS